MKKISFLVVIALIFTLLTQAVFVVNAEDVATGGVKFEDTRYRFKVVDFNYSGYQLGQVVNKDTKGIPVELEDGQIGIDKLIYPTIENYPLLGEKTNALKVLAPYGDQTVKEAYTSFKFTPGAKAGTSSSPLAGIAGIPEGTTDSGIMIHIESKGIGEKPLYNINYYLDKTKKEEVYWVEEGYQHSINITYNENEVDENGEILKKYNEDKEEDVRISAAYNMGTGSEITFVWTKDKSFTYKVKEKDATGAEVVVEKSTDKKVGDIDIVKSEGGSILVPRGFCGYMLIPFSSMAINQSWMSDNPNGVEDSNKMFDLKKIISCGLYTGFYPNHEGEIWFSDYNFYGPVFSKVNGAIDMGADMSIKKLTKPGTPVGSGEMPSENPSTDPSVSNNQSSGNEQSNPTSGSNGVGGLVATLIFAGVVGTTVLVNRKKR